MASDRRTELLERAEFLMRTRGYSDFSYADLAKAVEIRKASIHHHFPTKQDLGEALIHDYLDRFCTVLEEIKSESDSARGRLTAFAKLFASSLTQGMLPLCGALSAERDALPENMRSLVSKFFQVHLSWLEDVLDAGIASGELRSDRPAKRLAVLLLQTLEGGCLVSWGLDDQEVVLWGFEEMLNSLVLPNLTCR